LPIFTFSAGTTNSLFNLALINGNTTSGGAAINNAGTLSVSSCVLSNNIALNGFGGAVNNSGTATFVSSSVSDNQAVNGGAIYNVGSLTIINSPLAGNRAGNGGAIFNTISVALNTVNISSNTATLGFGGGIYNAGTMTVNSSALVGNSAIGGAGGSGYDIGAGGGAGLGGAIFTTTGNAAVTNTTIAGNVAVGGSGGNALMNAGTTNATANGGGNNPGMYIETGSPNGGFGGGGGGGQRGFYPYFGGNGGFGGGGGGIGPITGSNNGFGGGDGSECTSIYGNSGGGGGGIGAGIFVEGGTLELVNCTVASNSATGGGGGAVGAQGCGGNGGQGIGAGVFNYSGSVYLLNSIVAGNSTANSSPDLYGAFVTTGFNLIGNNQGATNLSINDFQNVAANLGPLQNNGGPTLTCVPLAGSYAIGYGSSSGAPTTDQRGVPRPQGGGFDIGAVQTVTSAPINVGPSVNSSSGFSVSTIFDTTNSYRVQGSTNLTTWTVLTNYASGGSKHFLDSSATNFNRRFYRVVSP
jgi:hypothetical protein